MNPAILAAWAICQRHQHMSEIHPVQLFNGGGYSIQVWDDGFEEPCKTIKDAIDRDEVRQQEIERQRDKERNKPELDQVAAAAKLAAKEPP